MSPMFAVLARVMDGLETDWGDLLGSHQPAPGEKLVSFANPSEISPRLYGARTRLEERHAATVEVW
jgi:hypothetical protein